MIFPIALKFNASVVDIFWDINVWNFSIIFIDKNKENKKNTNLKNRY